MKRDLQQMAGETHDLVIVGGGVTGACIARDAAMRGLRVALLERGDFCHATSAASSKLIHGGLRYLRNFELSLVRESLRERRIWEVIAPHHVHPLPMMLPVYKGRGPSKLALRAGLTLYDMLAYDRNRLEDEDKKLPGHRVLSSTQALEIEPGLPRDGLVGAVVYYDCQMHCPERLCLEHLLDAADRGARVANYAEVTEFVVEGTAVQGVRVRDVLHGTEVEIRGSVTINASGPWADRVLARLPEADGRTRLVRSKGIHLVTRPLTRDHAVAIEAKGSHFFLLPWRGHTLIGTTDTVFRGDPDDFAVTEDDIAQFLATINAGYPSAKLGRDDVQWSYGGLRPLVESGGEDEDGTYDASRRAEIVDHAAHDGPENLLSAMGGKWTTSRHLAEQVLAIVERKLGRPLPACATAAVPLPGGHTGRFAAFVAEARRDHPDLPEPVVDHLVRHYGSGLDAVLEHAHDEPALRQPVGDGHVDIGAQVVHAVRHEMALRLSDVLLRRTGIGTLGHPGAAALQAVADRMAAELAWNDERRADELRDAEARYAPRGDR